MQYSLELERKFQQKLLASGKKVNLLKIRRYINIDFRILHWEIDLQTKRRFSKRKSNLLTVFIWSILSSSKLKIRHSTKRLRKETKNCTNWEQRLLKLLLFFLIPERNFSTCNNKILSSLRNSMS
jgi:hypothetical protein